MEIKKCDCCSCDGYFFENEQEYTQTKEKMVADWVAGSPARLTNERAVAVMEEMVKLFEEGLVTFDGVRKSLLRLGVFVMPEFSVQGVVTVPRPLPLFLDAEGVLQEVDPPAVKGKPKLQARVRLVKNPPPGEGSKGP